MKTANTSDESNSLKPLDKRVLFITHDRREAENLAPMLEEMGYKWQYARDAVEGLEFYENFLPDLIILNALVPRGGGFEVCRSIRQQRGDKTTKILITSPVSSGTIQLEGRIKWGADDVILLPISLKKMVRIVVDILGDSDKADELSMFKDMIVRRETPIEIQQAPSKIGKVGDLESISLGRVISLLVKRRLTGSLILGENEIARELLLHEGRILAIQSDYIFRLGLGDILQTLGWIDEKSMGTFLEISQKERQLLGVILRREGILDGDRLFTALTEQAIRKLAEAFTWKTGKYQFVDRQPIVQVGEPLNLSLAKAAFRAARKSCNPQTFDSEYANWLDQLIYLKETASIRPNLIDLSPEETRVVFSLNGNFTLRQLLAGSPLPEKESLSLFHALLRLGMISRKTS